MHGSNALQAIGQRLLSKLICTLVLLGLITSALPSASLASGAPRPSDLSRPLNHGGAGAFAPAATCIKSDGTTRLRVDDSIANGAVEGCLIDYSAFPTVKVKVHNTHGYWTKVAMPYNLNDVAITPEDVYAKLGYIGPNGDALYTLTFDSSYNSSVQFFLNAAKSEDGRKGAGWFNITTKVLALFAIDEVSADLGVLQDILQAADSSTHLFAASKALEEFRLGDFIKEFSDALGDDAEVNILTQIAARMGAHLTGAAIKEALQGVKLVFEIKDIWETVWSSVTGSYAGTVTFSSKIQATPIPPQPRPTPPPLPTPTPQPTTDAATLVGDVTFPDGSPVAPGQAFVKTWQVQNSGTSTWTGYQLIFDHGDQLAGATPASIPGSIAPGQTVNISVALQAPGAGGSRAGYWQVVNRDGVHVQGGQLAVKINVVPPTTNDHILDFAADPPSPSSTNTVRLHALVNWWSQYRAMRLRVDDQVIGETSAVEQYFNWDAGAAGRGTHTLVLEVASQTDRIWSAPERRVLAYTLQGAPAPTYHAPDRPAPVANPAYDWYVTIGNPPQLCAQATDVDPGDTLQYQFQAVASVGTYTSGWVGNCYTFPGVNPGTYEWRARARDSHGLESGWSDPWHFTVEASGVTINPPSVTPGSPSTAERVDFCLTTSGHATVNIDVRAQVNTANDGSDHGQWRYLDGYLPGSSQWCWWWNTLQYGDGPHRVRFDARAWEPAADDVYELTYTLQHRRPASPELVSPVPASANLREAAYLKMGAINFRWTAATNATGYTLYWGRNPQPKDDPQAARQSFGAGTTQYTVLTTQESMVLYWQVVASNDAGSSASGDQLFVIDTLPPSCAVRPLPATTVESAFQVSWTGSDGLSGIGSVDVQYLDSGRSAWQDWLLAAPAGKTYDVFTGQPGHSYAFRCRATDNAGNTGLYPASADTQTRVDPGARPATPWWNQAYGTKRNLVILNNMGGAALPAGYPVHLHFDGGTLPTAGDLYNASLANPKCDDLRIVANDTTPLNRLVVNCSSTAIDLWFRTAAAVAPGSSDSTTHQLYYGNANPGSPPADPNQVWYPYREADTAYLYFFQEGSGSTARDASGNGRDCTVDPSVQWAPAKWGNGLRFNRANGGNSRSLVCGAAALASFTIEFWIKPDADGDGRIAGQIWPGNSPNWLLNSDAGNIKLTIWPCNTCGASDVKSNFSLRQAPYAGQWNHVAVTFDGGNTVSFYVNGALDSTKHLAQTGYTSHNVPLEIGSTEGISQIKDNLGPLRISTGVKTSFPYGAYGAITNEPSLAAGSTIAPPVTGTADLRITGLAAYPNLGGGTLVQATIRNQGNLSTQNGFYTDLYGDHLPTGPGDLAGSLRYWVAGPIAAGQSITLTAVITSTPGGSQAAAQVMAPGSEITRTLYAQADSAGMVRETDKSNNIFAPGVATCTAAPDAYENDDSKDTARLVMPGAMQHHNLDRPADSDWLRFQAQAGQEWVIATTWLGANADTVLHLYGPDGETLLASNDDYNGGLASLIDWTAPAAGTYYVSAHNWNPAQSGCGTGYDIYVSVRQNPGAEHHVWLPAIVRGQ